MVKFQCIHESELWQDALLSILNSAEGPLSPEIAMCAADDIVLGMRKRSSLIDGELHGEEREPDRPS